MENIGWDMESLRVTIFAWRLQSVSALWQDATGQKPENNSDRPQEQLQTADGPVGANTLMLAKRPGRLDSLVYPQVGSGSGINKLSHAEAADLLGKVAQKTLAGRRRSAYGPILIKQTDDLDAALRDLASLLPYVDLECRGRPDLPGQPTSQTTRQMEVNRLHGILGQ